MEDGLVKFQREDSRLISAVGVLIVKVLWFWLAGAKKLVVIKKISASLR
jgi:hypothetical protein